MTTNYERSHALPMFGDGYIPKHRDRAVEQDDSGFMNVLALLLRSWPYIRPQFLGRWWVPGKGVEDRVADTVVGGDYSFNYAPFLVALIAIAGPLLDVIPLQPFWPYGLLYTPIAVMVAGMFVMAFARGNLQTAGTVVVLIAGILANVAATYVIDGYPDGLYTAAVSIACITGWALQYRTTNGRVEFRVRSGTHLVYFYAINFFQRFLALSLALIVADLLYQNLLQGAPLAPGLAELLGLPEWSQDKISTLSAEQRHELKWIYATIALAVAGIQIVLGIISSYYNIWIMQRINQDLRVALVERWHQLSLSYHNEHRTGDSIFRIYQDSAMVTAVIGHLIGITLALMSYYTCVALVTLLSPWIGLITGLLVIPALLWARWAMPRMRVRTLVYRAATSDVTSTIQETFSAIKLIKAFNANDRAEQRMEEDSIVAFNAAYRVRMLIAIVSIIMFTFAATFMIAGEFLMAWWAHHEDPTFAKDLIALIGVSFVVWNLASFNWTKDQFRESSGNLRKLLRDWMTAQDMAMGLRRVFDILDIEPEVKDRDDAVPMLGFDNEIRYDDVRFAYQADRPVLEGVNFSARPGTVTAIIGPTGSGKSTLMALLLRLFEATSGKITIDGRSIDEFQVESLRANIAIALQENVLFAMSVADNIRYVAPDASVEDVQEAIRVAAMEEYVAGLPRGLDTVLSDRGGKLSTGQRQRLSIARAVVRQTPILILDEPTAALDAATEHQVMDNLEQWVREGAQPGMTKSGRAIFLITHRISTIRRADNILYLEAGRIVESGNHESLMALENGRYRSFVETEAASSTAETNDE